jgi:hypothetical protein
LNESTQHFGTLFTFAHLHDEDDVLDVANTSLACYDIFKLGLSLQHISIALPSLNLSIPASAETNHTNLNRGLVRNRDDALWLVLFRADSPSTPRHHRLPLQQNLLTTLLRLAPLRRVLLHPVEELIS